jgi:uncharacterized membrane protein
MLSYLVWKLAHNVAVILFLGNIITGLFWGAHARRTRDLRVVGAVFDGIIRSDRWFTLPSVLVVLVSGIIVAGRAGLPVFGTGWILWSSASFAVSGLLFVLRVAPLQRQIRDLALSGDLARNTAGAEEGWGRVGALYRQWEVFGGLSIAAAVLPLVLMVLKTSLPAF